MPVPVIVLRLPPVVLAIMFIAARLILIAVFCPEVPVQLTVLPRVEPLVVGLFVFVTKPMMQVFAFVI